MIIMPKENSHMVKMKQGGPFSFGCPFLGPSSFDPSFNSSYFPNHILEVHILEPAQSSKDLPPNSSSWDYETWHSFGWQERRPASLISPSPRSISSWCDLKACFFLSKYGEVSRSWIVMVVPFCGTGSWLAGLESHRKNTTSPRRAQKRSAVSWVSSPDTQTQFGPSVWL